MPNNNTTVQFSAQGLQEIKTSAIGLLRDLVSYTEKYNKESKETLEILKEQIQLLTERNRASGVSGGSQGGGIAGGGSGQTLTLLVDEIKLLKEEERQGFSSVVTQLKETLNFLKDFSLSGSISGTVGKKILSATIDLGGGGGPSAGGGGGGGEDSTEGGGSRERERREGGGSNSAMWTRDLYKLVDLLGGAAKSDDYAEFYTKSLSTIATTIAGNGILGAAVGIPTMAAAMGAQVLIDMYDKRQQAAQGNVQLFGGTLSGTARGAVRTTTGTWSPLSEMGYSYVDYLNERARTSQALGRQTSFDQVRESFLMQKGAGVDSSLTDSIFRLLRGNRRTSAADVVGGVVRGQRLGDDWSPLQEHLQLLVSISEKQLQEMGTTNLTLNNQVLSGLSKISEDFKNPVVLASVFQRTYEGSQKAKTPQFQAMQYRTLDKIARESGDERFRDGFSMWDLTKIMENPEDKLFGKFITTLMNNLYQSQGKQNFEMILKSQYGFSVDQLEKFSAAAEKKGGIQLVDYSAILTGGEKLLESKALAATTSIERRQAETTDAKGVLFNDTLEKITQDTLGAMQKLNDTLMDAVSSLSEGVKKIRKKINESDIE